MTGLKWVLGNPGSKQALLNGCTCAVMDNHHGEGFPYKGEQCFYISGGCPIHAVLNRGEPDD